MRRLCTTLAVLSLLLCFGIAALWARSYWRGDTLWNENRRSLFNVNAEASLDPRGPRTRLLAEIDRDAWLLKSGRGNLILVSARYSVRPADKDGWVDKLQMQVPPPGPAETYSAETRWMSSWRHVDEPSWPDAPTLLGVNRGYTDMSLQEQRDLSRLTKREHLRSETPIRSGFGFVRWHHDDEGKAPQAAGHVTFDAHGLAFPYWFLCLLSLTAALGFLLLRKHARKRLLKAHGPRGRRTLPAVAALSTILLLLTGLLWVRSHWRQHILHLTTKRLLFADELIPPMPSRPNPELPGYEQAGYASSAQSFVDTLPAGLRWNRRHTEFDHRKFGGWSEPGRPGMIRRWGVTSFPRERFVAPPSNSRRFLGSEYATGQTSPTSWISIQHRHVLVPWWFLMLTFSIAPGLFAWRIIRQRKRIRRERGLCIHCGYDLRATPDRCPECGAEATGGTLPALQSKGPTGGTSRPWDPKSVM